ncbi:sensor histidine kinase [Deinococcus roseus]|uniref:histidine kinase n=1 Tax=Deinococcus roseus TaxID=392414 RepID=A0ABQ2CT81_9DEIO|nr:ATP-binding protein [Deinococcus roseus]GGJ18214.1 hypothetical protein GCM10008938_00440 [Deinococcus roseus]
MTLLEALVVAVAGMLAGGWLCWVLWIRQSTFAQQQSSAVPPDQKTDQQASPADSTLILNALKDQGHDAWWVTDLQGQPIGHNRCARELLGLAPEQAFPALSELDIYQADSKTLAIHLLDQAKSNELLHVDHWIGIQEVKKPIRLTGKAIVGHSGEPVGLLFVAQDRTAELTREITASQFMLPDRQEDLQTLNAALNVRTEELLLDLHQRNLELEAANRDLQSFAHSVAHDLRTPLRGLDGFSQALMEDYGDSLDDTARGYLQRIRKASQRLGDLLDDLLDYSRVTRAAMQVNLLDLSALTSRVASSLPRPGQQDIDLQIEGHMQVYGDLVLIRTLMQHLLTNSFKFSAGKPHPVIRVGSLVQEQETVYYVRDNGVGFDMRFAGQMFQPFHRLHGNLEFEGNGMGLAVVKRIVERHGGRIWAEGKPQEGATLYFTLPALEERP